MAAKKAKVTKAYTPAEVRVAVTETLAQLERIASKRVREEMGPRYGIHTKKAYGVPMAKLQAIAKQLGRDHALAAALWKTGWYEARMIACMVDDPAQVTPAQMDAWIAESDNWAIVDTICFKLFDQTPHVFTKAAKWAKSRDEFVRRGGYVLLACGALHGVGADADYLKLMPLIEKGALDERNFAKKGVNWALRAIGGKKSLKLRTAARVLAAKLAQSEDATARWVGKDALRAFAKADR
jgi:3-methyladenine DNA glycosylase AlkD